MNATRRFAGLVLAGVLTAGLQARAEEPAKPAAGDAKQAAEMATWMKYAMPGEAHKVLQQLAGHWKTETHVYMAPGSQPQTSTGEGDFTAILDGRFIEQHYKGQFMGNAYQGVGYLGYDNYKQKYSSVWMDSLGTSITVGYGTYDQAKNTLTFEGTYDDVMSGKSKSFKMVLRDLSPQRYVFEMYDTGADGKEWRNLEIVHTR